MAFIIFKFIFFFMWAQAFFILFVQPTNALYSDLTSTDQPAAVECEDNTGFNMLDLSCPPGQVIQVTSSNYGRLDSTTCPHTAVSNTNCMSTSTTDTIVKGACQNQQSCSLPAHHCYLDNNVDPCPGTFKYLQVEYQCCDTSMTTEMTVRACESDTTTLDISCSSGQTITITAANYGRTDLEGPGDQCPGKRSGLVNTCYGTSAMTNAANDCDGQESCSITPNNAWHGSDPCSGVAKYLEVTYTCSDEFFNNNNALAAARRYNGKSFYNKKNMFNKKRPYWFF